MTAPVTPRFPRRHVPGRSRVLRLRRFVVFCVFAICVVTAVSFWALERSGADAGGALPPPRSEAKFETRPGH